LRRDVNWVFATRHMAFLLGHWQVLDSGTWAVTHRESGAFLRMVGYSKPESWPGFELAWTLVRRAWGQGYATEAARATLDCAFTILKRDRIFSLIHLENWISIRVAERPEGRVNHLGAGDALL
jgi:RimJ/RimL family protein N-acetyltransferase